MSSPKKSQEVRPLQINTVAKEPSAVHTVPKARKRHIGNRLTKARFRRTSCDNGTTSAAMGPVKQCKKKISVMAADSTMAEGTSGPIRQRKRKISKVSTAARGANAEEESSDVLNEKTVDNASEPGTPVAVPIELSVDDFSTTPDVPPGFGPFPHPNSVKMALDEMKAKTESCTVAVVTEGRPKSESS